MQGSPSWDRPLTHHAMLFHGIPMTHLTHSLLSTVRNLLVKKSLVDFHDTKFVDFFMKNQNQNPQYKFIPRMYHSTFGRFWAVSDGYICTGCLDE